MKRHPLVEQLMIEVGYTEKQAYAFLYRSGLLRKPAKGARPSRAGMHRVTEDCPSVYGSHLLGREGQWIHKSELTPPARRAVPKAEEE